VKRQHKTPCGKCPFRRASLPGWLGGRTALEFAELANTEARMPCHSHHRDGVDYEEAQTPGTPMYQSPQCAGRAIYWANQIKAPRTSDLLTLPKDEASVIGWPTEFIQHHEQGIASVAQCLFYEG